MNLKNKKVLITGATGGIGNCILKKLDELGAKIVASGTNEQKLINLKKKFPNIQEEKFKLDDHDKIENFIESINKKLDPNYHQAMMEIEDDSKDPGTIIKEIQKGFLLKDRLLRPSLVGVSKKPSKKEEKNEEIKENSEDK